MTGPDRRNTKKGGTMPILVMLPDVDHPSSSFWLSAFSNGFLSNAFNSDVTSDYSFSSAFSSEFGNEFRMADDFEDFQRTISSHRRAYSEVGEVKLSLDTADSETQVGYHVIGEADLDLKARTGSGKFLVLGEVLKSWSVTEDDLDGHNDFSGRWDPDLDPDGSVVTSARTFYDGDQLDILGPGPTGLTEFIYDSVRGIHGGYAHINTTQENGYALARFDNLDPTAREIQFYMRIIGGTGNIISIAYINGPDQFLRMEFDQTGPSIRLNVNGSVSSWYPIVLSEEISGETIYFWYRVRLIWSIGGSCRLYVYENEATDAVSPISVTPVVPLTTPPTDFGIGVSSGAGGGIIFDIDEIRWSSGPFRPEGTY